MTSFVFCWWLSFAVLLVFASWWGKQSLEGETEKNAFAILIDSRGRISLTHLQVVMWTLLVLSTLLGLLTSDLIKNWTGGSGLQTTALAIPDTLLALMGISAGSAATAVAAKSAKDLKEEKGTNDQSKPRAFLRQVITQEEGAKVDKVVDVTKFQNFIFTAVAGLVYVVLTMQAQDYPKFDSQMVWLIGISHAGYVAGKLPKRD